jgi:hypothetical protein
MPTIDQLEAALASSDADAVMLSQNGVAKKATRAQFLAGMQPQLLIGPSRLVGRSTSGVGAPEAIAIGAGLTLASGLLSATATLPLDAVRPEDYGAVGDGTTDDTAAFSAAVSSGKPIRLGARTYIVNGQWTISQTSCTIIGVPGASILRRAVQTGNGAWIAIQGADFQSYGVTFDANGVAVNQESWGVFVANSCTSARFTDCSFTNAIGSVQGCGLVLQGGPNPTSHVVSGCKFVGNALHGLWVQACTGVRVAACLAHDNGKYGICADFNDATFKLKVSLVQIAENRCWANQRGINVGNFNASNLQPPVWGNANPDAVAILVEGNICHDNSIYGIAAAGSLISVVGNLLFNNGVNMVGGGGILANVEYSRIASNMISGIGTYGIDVGGSLACDVSANQIQNPFIGINAGGGTNIRLTDNYLQDCSAWAIVVNNVEADGSGQTFGIASTNTAITNNWIAIASVGSGIWLHDGPQNVLVARNEFLGAVSADHCLRAETDSYIVDSNRFNFVDRPTINPAALGSRQAIVYPDITENVLVTFAPSGVQSIVSTTQAASLGKISFVRLQTGGVGYANAIVTIGGVGTGASARAILKDGAIIGINVLTSGSGYGEIGASVPVTISGDGSGATAIAYAAPPLPENRRLRISCNIAVAFARVASSPLQENWTLSDLDIAANSDVEWRAIWGTWRASGFGTADWYTTDQLGGALVRSVGNSDVVLRPSGSGSVRISSDAEPTGVQSLVGRGTPLGVRAAPPGSDYRNLNGGVGTTFWLKQFGLGNSGWVAVA